MNMLPTRLSLMTCNLWRTERWPDRHPHSNGCSTGSTPTCSASRSSTLLRRFLERALAGHTVSTTRYRAGPPRATSTGAARSSKRWTTERKTSATRSPIGACFGSAFAWAPYASRSSWPPPIHEPAVQRRACKGHPPRVRQLNRIAEALQKLVRDGEPAFFMGDMNDAWHPHNVLKRVGFVNCFAALGMQSPPTFQCYPTANIEPGEHSITEAIDILTANRHARPIAAAVPHCYASDVAPSDHWPVHAIYQLD